MLDPSDAVRSTIAVTAAAEANKRENQESVLEQAKERKLKKLMGLSPDEEFRVTTAIGSPKPNWKELEGLKSQLLDSCRKKTDVVRISAVAGHCDSLSAKEFSSKWVTLWTGEASELDVSFVVEKLTSKARPLTLYTMRVQSIVADKRGESFKTAAYVLYMTGEEPGVRRGAKASSRSDEAL